MSTTAVLWVLGLLLSRQCYGEVLLWGHDHLDTVALSPLDVPGNEYVERVTVTLEPQAIVVFIDTNSTYSIANQNLPKLKQLVEDYKSVYVPRNLPLIFTDVATTFVDFTDNGRNNDKSIYNTFKEVESKHDKGKTLAIFINDGPFDTVLRVKREITATEEKNGPGFYNAPGKGMLYTSLYPVLRILRENDTEVEYVLKKATTVTFDIRGPLTKLVITFSLEDASKVTLRFRFFNSRGYWSFSTVELDEPSNRMLILSTPNEMVAPVKFSYHCTGTIQFKNGSTSLTLQDIQVQPAPVSDGRFDDAYDCVDFTTVPIWSGLFVTAIMGGALVIAIVAILDIRTMDRFDDPKGKGLVIFVSE